MNLVGFFTYPRLPPPFSIYTLAQLPCRFRPASAIQSPFRLSNWLRQLDAHEGKTGHFDVAQGIAIHCGM